MQQRKAARDQSSDDTRAGPPSKPRAVTMGRFEERGAEGAEDSGAEEPLFGQQARAAAAAKRTQEKACSTTPYTPTTPLRMLMNRNYTSQIAAKKAAAAQEAAAKEKAEEEALMAERTKHAASRDRRSKKCMDSQDLVASKAADRRARVLKR